MTRDLPNNPSEFTNQTKYLDCILDKTENYDSKTHTVLLSFLENLIPRVI